MPEGRGLGTWHIAVGGGVFHVAPAQLQSLYAPEFTAYTSSGELKIRD